MLDAHCHLDRFENPLAVMRTCDERGAFVVAVTNLPSHFVAGRSHVLPFKRVRLALGLHPLTARQHAAELPLFERLLKETSFVGEVGLDFSRHGRGTEVLQLQTFRIVAGLLSSFPKLATIHSRGAERPVLDVLREYSTPPSVFHWYTGSIPVLEDILRSGHYFSVNPSMAASANGRKIINAIPPNRILTESDGPYGTVRGAPARPWDVPVIEAHLARVWNKNTTEVRAAVWDNFKRLMAPLRSPADIRS